MQKRLKNTALEHVQHLWSASQSATREKISEIVFLLQSHHA